MILDLLFHMDSLENGAKIDSGLYLVIELISQDIISESWSNTQREAVFILKFIQYDMHTKLQLSGGSVYFSAILRYLI